MTVQQWRRKPQDQEEVTSVALYVPGQVPVDLLTVAHMADRKAELAEVVFPSGPVLLVRWTNYPDDRGPQIEYLTVEPGSYLGYSSTYDSLYETDAGNLAKFYDEVTKP
jgi:hypothetical protein